MSYEEGLRTVGLTTLETRRLRLRADKAEVYEILRGFEKTDEVKKIQRSLGWDVQQGMIGNCLKRVLI